MHNSECQEFILTRKLLTQAILYNNNSYMLLQYQNTTMILTSVVAVMILTATIVLSQLSVMYRTHATYYNGKNVCLNMGIWIAILLVDF